MENCHAKNMKVTGLNHVGGLIGTFFTNKLKLKECYATGEIHVSYGAVGALLGEERGWVTNDNKNEVFVEMTGCYSSMTIESKSYKDSELTLMCRGWHKWEYADCYYITSHSGQTPTSGLTCQPEITPKMINAMNAALGSKVYNADGTFK